MNELSKGFTGMDYEVGDRVRVINHWTKNELVGKVVKIEGHYAVYIECDDGELRKLERRHWLIKKDALEEIKG